MRECKTCGVTKPYSEFHARKGYKDGIKDNITNLERAILYLRRA